MRASSLEPCGRRGFLGACAAIGAAGLGPCPAQAETLSDDLEVRLLSLSGDRRLARRALALVPKRAAKAERWPVLVLLHGLAETESEALGLRAWSDRYGLVAADARLRHPPVSAERGRYLPPQRAARINDELRRKPYRGFVLVCPVTPNVYKLSPTATALDRYADWIAGVLLPAVREGAPARTDAASTAIDGCSLGGYVALEVFLRKPELFGAVGGVQTAIGDRSAIAYADKLRAAMDRVGPRAVHIETSVWDPSRKSHEAMSARLQKLGVGSDLSVLPGGHDQIFLREIGTLEMLLWHDRRQA